MKSSLLIRGHLVCLLVLLIQFTNGKPLCDSLEEYFRNRKEPGSRRLKKTITRICTAFDVVKYDGVDPLELLLPPNEDDDIVGGGREPEPSEHEEDFLPEDFVQQQDFAQSQDFEHTQDFDQHQDFTPHDSRQQDSSDHSGNTEGMSSHRHPFHMHHHRINPWAFHPGFPMRFPGPVWMGSSNRRQEKLHKTPTKQQATSVEEWESAKIQEPNSTTTTVPPVNTVTTTRRTTPKPVLLEKANGSLLTDIEDEEDDDVDDPLLNDLADFVASIRFLSLNDTQHLSVILPESTASPSSRSSSEDLPIPYAAQASTGGHRRVSAPSRSNGSAKQGSSSKYNGELGKASLAIEAPDDLLPKSYTRSSPAVDNEAGLPNIHQVHTQFTCDKQLYFPGVYSDIYTDCRVFHLCLPDGYGFRSASFMCPKGLRYSQQRLRCDRAQDVDCSASTSHYANNQYFSRNYVDYLHSLKVLLHGDDGELKESSEVEADYASDQNETDESPDSFGNTINTSMLNKLKNVITETN